MGRRAPGGCGGLGWDSWAWEKLFFPVLGACWRVERLCATADLRLPRRSSARLTPGLAP